MCDIGRVKSEERYTVIEEKETENNDRYEVRCDIGRVKSEDRYTVIEEKETESNDRYEVRCVT